MRRALLSVSDKTGIVELGRGLAARGFELVSTGGTARAFRFDLMRKAIAHTAAYDTAITGTLASVTLDGDRFERHAPAEPGHYDDQATVSLLKIRDLRYGENPHQKAAWYGRSGPCPE